MKKILLLSTLVLLTACSSNQAPALLPDDDFLIIAHRGASAYAPEHSLLAYDLAIQMEADYIELDVHLTSDKELVSLHDSFIVLEDGRQAIADTTFQELKGLLRKSSFNGKMPVSLQQGIDPLRIVSTEEIFSHFKQEANYYIEIKSPASYPGIEMDLLQQLHNHGLLPVSGEIPNVILQSFHADSLKIIHKEEPDIPLIQLYSKNNESMLTQRHLKKVASYASGIGVDAKSVTKELVELAHQEGLHVHPYTVNDEGDIRDMIELGVDGIFTDVPDKAFRIMNE